MSRSSSTACCITERGGHAGPYCEGARGLIGSKKMDAQADARRSLQSGRFVKTIPESRNSFPFSRYGCCSHREHVIQYAASDKEPWGTSIKGRHATKRCEGVSSAVNRDLRGERGVVESNDTADEAGAVFWQRQGGVDPRRDRQDLGAVVRRRVRKTGKKLRRRTWTSAGQSHRARRRWRNLINSAG